MATRATGIIRNLHRGHDILVCAVADGTSAPKLIDPGNVISHGHGPTILRVKCSEMANASFFLFNFVCRRKINANLEVLEPNWI